MHFEEISIEHPNKLFQLFTSKTDLLLLTSSQTMENDGRYSYICFDAFATFIAKEKLFLWNSESIEIHCPFEFIREKMNEYVLPKNPLIPPFQGGAAGYFGYEASHYLETLPKIIDNIQLPDIYLNFYSNVIAIDHLTHQCWIIATGFPEKNEKLRLIKAKADVQTIKSMITSSVSSQTVKQSHEITLQSNFTQETYIDAVKKTKNYILNGDIFQANISQQFKTTLLKSDDPLALYLQLLSQNPAPFSAYIAMPGIGAIISASPERFIKITEKIVETAPIKGTRKRSPNPAEDQQLAEELASSEKDIAENVMIVDLMRNDLSKVCQPGSIHVNALCELKSFETVHHLVSKITAQLKMNMNAIDLLKATFPPGSVTGAPKIRAMEIISELEMQTRGPYCGCLGFLSFSGDMDTSVIIRSYFIKSQNLFFSAGGAVVLNSEPMAEYLESLAKARALIHTLGVQTWF